MSPGAFHPSAAFPFVIENEPIGMFLSVSLKNVQNCKISTSDCMVYNGVLKRNMSLIAE